MTVAKLIEVTLRERLGPDVRIADIAIDAGGNITATLAAQSPAAEQRVRAWCQRMGIGVEDEAV